MHNSGLQAAPEETPQAVGTYQPIALPDGTTMTNIFQPQDGRGFFMLPQAPEEAGYYVYGTPGGGAAHFSHPKLLSLILVVEREWQAIDSRKFGIGNISIANGLPFGHESHMKGLEVDVRPLRKDGKQIPINYTDSQYDRAATSQLRWSRNFGHNNRFTHCHFPFIDGGRQIAQC
ncbi:penicillin-insensitive murein endopeptidase [Pseudoduganella violacea]|uniref:Uncharacterized protein n=1 Tax=Pseudoduganella violacea TaxID=1715466 RepID=A0A7W5BAJ0_9BURK|nr:penicillin-insensitive murein endopeptidase [Pseudoduganella violacea]MBB3119351.1 hypothetical protein [Pseudoduganella violacea]